MTPGDPSPPPDRDGPSSDPGAQGTGDRTGPRPRETAPRPSDRTDPALTERDPSQEVGSEQPLPADWVEPERPLGARVLEAVDSRLPLVLLAPALVVSLSLVVYPVAVAVELSLHEVALLDTAARTYVGLDNYRWLLADPFFYEVLWNTAVFVGASVAGQFGLGLGLALLLERRWLDDRLARLFRTTFLLPWATTGVIVAYSWRVVFDARLGLVNRFLRWVGVANPPAWLGSVEWAMVAVIVANVWRGLPFSVIFQTSGLQSIPDRLHEAADVGGASTLQSLRYVTLPLLRPFVAMNLVLITLFTVNVFDIVYVMTGGGPLESTEVLSLHMYDTAFAVGRFGRASALAVVLLAINVTLVMLYLRALGGRRGVAS